MANLTDTQPNINIRETARNFPPPQELSATSNGRYLLDLCAEKKLVLIRLENLLMIAGLSLDTSPESTADMTAKQLLMAIMNCNPYTAGLDVLNQQKIRDVAPMIERLVGIAICDRHSKTLTQHLLHIEFIEDQIDELLPEIQNENQPHPCKQSPPLTWEETFALVNSLPDLDDSTTIEILVDAGYDIDQCQRKFGRFKTA